MPLPVQSAVGQAMAAMVSLSCIDSCSRSFNSIPQRIHFMGDRIGLLTPEASMDDPQERRLPALSHGHGKRSLFRWTGHGGDCLALECGFRLARLHAPVYTA